MKPLFLFLVLLSFPLRAEIFQTNPDHSEIFFQVPYLKLSEVTGRFEEFHGRLELDSSRSPVRLSLKVKTASVHTGNKLRDSHLRGHDFLKVKDHPEMVFISESVAPVKENFRAQGKLSIQGKVVPLAVDFSLSDEVTDTWNKVSRFVKFDFTLSRDELGLSWNKTLPGESFLLGDKIRVWGSFQLQPAGALTHGTKHMIPDTPYAREREKVLRGEIEETSIRSSVEQLPEVPRSEVRGEPAPETSSEVVQDPRGRLSWIIAFGVVGLMGFFSTIIIGIQFKRWIHRRTQEAHSEIGFLGLASDAFIILIVFIYAVSLWEVGWG